MGVFRTLSVAAVLALCTMFQAATATTGTWMCVEPDSDYMRSAVACDSDSFAGVTCPESSCGETIKSRRVFCSKLGKVVTGVEDCDLSAMPSNRVTCPYDTSGCFKDVEGTRCNLNARGEVDPALENITCRPVDKPDLKAYRYANCAVDKKTRYPANPALCGQDDLLLECRLQSCADTVSYEWVRVPTGPCVEEKSRCETYAHSKLFCSTKPFQPWLATGADGVVVDDSFCESRNIQRPSDVYKCLHSNSHISQCANGAICKMTPASEDGQTFPGVNVGKCACGDRTGGDFCQHDGGAQIASVHLKEDNKTVLVTFFSNNFKGTEHLRATLYAWEGPDSTLPTNPEDRVTLGVVEAIDTYASYDISAFGALKGFIFVGTYFGSSPASHSMVLPDRCIGVTCLNGGTCSGGTCKCAEGFSGETCEVDNCSGVECGENSSCELATGECVCNENYSGPQCETYVDPACKDVDCGDHGHCDAGVCECDSGFSGDKCETPDDVCKGHTCPYPNQVCSDSNGVASCACPKDDSGKDLYADNKCEVPAPCATQCGASAIATGHYDASGKAVCNCSCVGNYVPPQCTVCGLKAYCKNGASPNSECTGCRCTDDRHGNDCTCRLVNIRLVLAAPSDGALNTSAILHGIHGDVRIAANSTSVLVYSALVGAAVSTDDGTFHTLTFKLGETCSAAPFKTQADDNPEDKAKVHKAVNSFVAYVESGSADSMSVLGQVDKSKGIGVEDPNCTAQCPTSTGSGGQLPSNSSGSSGLSNNEKLGLGLGIGLGCLVIIAIIAVVCLLSKKEGSGSGTEDVQMETRV